MKTPAFYITDYDKKRLQGLIRKAKNWPKSDMELLGKLKAKLDATNVIPQKEAPPYLITMNCQVCVTDLGNKRNMEFWLAYPEDASFGNDKVSIVSDMGIAILGSKTGAKVEVVNTNNNKKVQLRISNIFYQPEANQHYKL
ncbi:MAG: GreA/GreB family elongation factor [Phycisphaerae bacterium]|nr:GreA/GreB family elongation factor [Phycisphaerae bacterium]